MMKQLIPPVLRELAERFGAPLYAVGGTVRDCLAGFPLGERPDWDVSSPADENELLRCAERCGWSVRSVFRNTGTVKLEKDGVQCEFTRFRSDKYVRGVHAPSEIEFTDDIRIDARRRDFTANAVYYAIKADALCDPLGGAEDIRKKIMRTVVSARKVFGEDGLRLMRLARLCAQTGFMPDPEAYAGAREHAALIEDIAPERIFTELSLLLSSDLKHGDPEAPYRGLCVLRDTVVFKRVLPARNPLRRAAPRLRQALLLFPRRKFPRPRRRGKTDRDRNSYAAESPQKADKGNGRAGRDAYARLQFTNARKRRKKTDRRTGRAVFSLARTHASRLFRLQGRLVPRARGGKMAGDLR